MMAAPLLGFDVNNDEHALAWQRSYEHLRGSIATLRGTHEPVDILAMLHDGSLFLWPGQKASAITQIDVYPRKTVCHVFLLGGPGGLGEIQAWGQRDGPLDHWAFDRWHCDWISHMGRRGWSRMMDCEPLGEVGMRTRA
ncbi:MAG: hypothetical protein HC871_12915 [Rhizobiales bacterium]|nr:hypothetical protein [Hyphomicrobiales bacterium]